MNTKYNEFYTNLVSKSINQFDDQNLVSSNHSWTSIPEFDDYIEENLPSTTTSALQSSRQTEIGSSRRSSILSTDSVSTIKTSSTLGILFNDEPKGIRLKKEFIDSFKEFLKNTNGYLFYKLWIDIEKLHSIVETQEKMRYI